MVPAVLTIARFWNDTERTVVMNRVTANPVHSCPAQLETQRAHPATTGLCQVPRSLRSVYRVPPTFNLPSPAGDIELQHYHADCQAVSSVTAAGASKADANIMDCS
jgi:hypothetical protein